MINGKTLILRFSSLGDVVMTVPVIRSLEKKYPENKFIFVTRPKFTPFFQEFNNVETFELDLKKRHKGFLGLFRLFSDLKKLKPKRIADLHSVLRTQLLSFLFKMFFIKVSVIDKKRKERKALTRKNNKIFKPLTPIHFLYQEVFNKLGFSIDLTKDHVYPPSKVFNLNTNTIDIGTGKLIGIAPFAKHQGKMYPLDLMQKIVSYIQDNHTVFLFGYGKIEMQTINRWSSALNNVYSCEDLGGFENEVALISNLNLMISMDSANGHIASIYNVPVITLWGLTHPYTGFTTFNSDLKNQFCVDREKFPLVPNSIYGNKMIKGYENAMRTISVEEVLGRANEILLD
jgi:ADP-heptose:LPS heptosyltransferase